MILDRNTENIKYITIDCQDYSWSWDDVPKIDLSDYVRKVDLGKGYSSVYSTWNCKYQVFPYDADGIYLGGSECINNEIKAKINPTSPADFKTVYFDPMCKYPRFRLNTLTNIKRCLNPKKADSVIISPLHFIDHKVDTCVNNASEESLILYSKKENCYYFLDFYPVKLDNSKNNDNFQTLFSKYADPQCTGLHKWASALIACSALPSDSVEFYFGKVVLTNNINETQFLKNLFTDYMLLTYDTELDHFISSKLQKMTTEDIEAINKMMSSSDESVVDMSLKLLSNYNIMSCACSVSILIIHNWNKIVKSSVLTSTGFKQILYSLNLEHTKISNYGKRYLISKLYKQCTDSEDKEKARHFIKNIVEGEIADLWESKYSTMFDMDFTFKFTIE